MMKETRQRLASVLLAAALVLAPAIAQTKWDMPTPYTEGSFHTRNIVQFAEEVEKATVGGLKIQVYAAGSLIKHPEIKRSVRQGIAPIGEIFAALAAGDSLVFSVDTVPFLTDGHADAKKLYEAQRPVMDRRLASEGLILLYSVPWPPLGLYTKKQIRSVEDLSGLKLRTSNAYTSRIAQLVRAVPTQIEAPDIPKAFANGRVEAMIASSSTGVDVKAWTFLTHYYDLQAWQPRNMVIANKAAFDKLTVEQRKALTEAAKAAEERGWAAAEKETAEKTKVLADNKIVVVEPPPALKKAMQEVGATIAKEWDASTGAEGKAILDAYRSRQ